MNPSSDLGGHLLAGVSRSFYLSVRALPPALQAPIGLGYLLARASDTIADCAEIPWAARREHLSAFGEIIRTGARDSLGALQTDIQPAEHTERRLIERLPECLDWLEHVSDFERAEIRSVLAHIIRGQSLDLERFGDGSACVALADGEQLEEYTYLVAGCVGEFWTRLCAGLLASFSRVDSGHLSELGKHFGQGLQLINILRDLRADLAAGRCYLPQSELAAIGVAPDQVLECPERTRPVVARWMDRARAHLDDGQRYITAVPNRRVRVACFMPWYLGRRTLALLELRPPLLAPDRVKVPRSTVRKALLFAIPVAFSNRALGWVARGA
jgi:farnesyl-diphosphate farnesyltransferase